MPRRPRVFAAGSIYHVYNHVARGERPFAGDREAERFVAVLHEAKKRDGVTVLAWCVMPTHYHLLVRTGDVPLWRTMHYIQHRFAVEMNRHQGVAGPFWQSRYKARPIEEKAYLDRVLGYIHLNPVAAGLVRDPARYRWSGHLELLGRRRDSLADVAEALSFVEDDPAVAARSYLQILKGMRNEKWLAEGPERLPWLGAAAGPDRGGSGRGPRARTISKPLVDRPRVPAGSLLARCCEILGVSAADAASRLRTPSLVRARQAMAALLVERWGVRVGELAGVIGRTRDGTSHLISAAVRRRVSDAAFSEFVDDLDRRLGSRVALVER
jgi:REP element-mobilizing transposase RayT